MVVCIQVIILLIVVHTGSLAYTGSIIILRLIAMILYNVIHGKHVVAKFFILYYHRNVHVVVYYKWNFKSCIVTFLVITLNPLTHFNMSAGNICQYIVYTEMRFTLMKLWNLKSVISSGSALDWQIKNILGMHEWNSLSFWYNL